MRILTTSFLASFLAFGLLNAAEQDTYIFEAKGEFAKELKDLVEKHSKDENVSINVYQAPHKDSRFLGIGIDKNIKYRADEGKKIYMKNCASCHGENGEKRAHGVSRKLKDITADEIALGISGYSADPEFGSKLKYLMQPIAAKTTARDVGYIIAYLKGEDSYIFQSFIPEENSKIQTTPTEQGTYIK